MPQTIHTLTCEDAIAFVCEAIWGFAELNDQGEFQWINDTYCSILNAPPTIVLGTNYQQWTHPDDIEIDNELATSVKEGKINGYTLSKRYIQRGSTPQNQRVIWGFLSVAGKWKNGSFVGYRVQFKPYNNLNHPAKIDLKQIFEWSIKNWKTIATIVTISTSLILGGSERLLNMLRDAKSTKQSIDTLLEDSQSGVSSQQP